MKNIFEEFQWRGLVYDSTEGLPETSGEGESHGLHRLRSHRPTACRSGNLLALMGLARLQRFGHTPIALAGGGTGLIGDPERQGPGTPIAEPRTGSRRTSRTIKKQLAHFLDFEVRGNPARHRQQRRLADDDPDDGLPAATSASTSPSTTCWPRNRCSTRLERQEGISYTEFSYMLLQAYDFLQLYDQYGCTLQAGRQRPVGQHHRGRRADPPRAERARLRPGLSAGHQRRRHEARQDGAGHDLARCAGRRRRTGSTSSG